MTKTDEPGLESDKQKKPFAGEASPESTRSKAALFSAKEKVAIKNQTLKFCSKYFNSKYVVSSIY